MVTEVCFGLFIFIELSKSKLPLKKTVQTRYKLNPQNKRDNDKYVIEVEAVCLISIPHHTTSITRSIRKDNFVLQREWSQPV